MAIPSFQEIFLPFLKLLSDGKDHQMAEVGEKMAEHFQLSQTDREEKIPSGGQFKFLNRVGWSRTHLYKAGLIDKVTWGVYRLTEEGRQVVQTPPAKLDLKFLDTIPRHKIWFHSPKAGKPVPVSEIKNEELQPPNERIEEAAEQLNNALAADLREHLSKMDPFRFEQLVVDLLFKMGYGGSRKEAAQVTKRSNDEGIDGVINEDRLGLDVVYIQAKRWQNDVGRKEIQSFVGALAGQRANKGVFITTSGFNSNAKEYAKSIQQKVVLIDGTRLAELMIEHDIGVSTTSTISLKRIDTDYFAET